MLFTFFLSPFTLLEKIESTEVLIKRLPVMRMLRPIPGQEIGIKSPQFLTRFADARVDAGLRFPCREREGALRRRRSVPLPEKRALMLNRPAQGLTKPARGSGFLEQAQSREDAGNVRLIPFARQAIPRPQRLQCRDPLDEGLIGKDKEPGQECSFRWTEGT